MNTVQLRSTIFGVDYMTSILCRDRHVKEYKNKAAKKHKNTSYPTTNYSNLLPMRLVKLKCHATDVKYVPAVFAFSLLGHMRNEVRKRAVFGWT